MNLKEKINGIVFGIKFSKSFRIPDVAGEVIDDILYNEKSPFGKKYFPKISVRTFERILHNPETGEYLRINTDDIIFGIVVNKNFDEKYNWIKNEVFKYLSDHLFKKYNIKYIKRFGIVFNHEIEKGQNFVNAIKTLTNHQIEDVENIILSFSKKSVSTDGILRKNVKDYRNTNYTFEEVESSLFASLDYQYYFEPIVEDLRECSTDKILDNAKSFLEQHYYKWLIQCYDKNESR